MGHHLTDKLASGILMTTQQAIIPKETLSDKNEDHGKETETVSSAMIATSRRLVGNRGIGALGMVSVFTTKTKGFQQAQSFFIPVRTRTST